jgi:hypothetical protein
MLKLAAGKLNLAAHQCKGLTDIAASSTFLAAETRIFRNALPVSRRRARPHILSCRPGP